MKNTPSVPTNLLKKLFFFFSGVLKQEIIDGDNTLESSHIDSWASDNSTVHTPRFTAIESKVSYCITVRILNVCIL